MRWVVRLVIVAALVALAVFAGRLMMTLLGAVVGVALASALIAAVRGSRAVRAFRRTWGVQGKDLLIVYSNSPHWQRYIEEEWLPHWRERAVILNWSHRAQWTDGPEVELFRAVVGRKEHNPVAIVVPQTGAIKVLRFWRAFREMAQGKEQTFRTIEAQLEALLNESPPPIERL
jgi:hypothetical protein